MLKPAATIANIHLRVFLGFIGTAQVRGAD